MEDKQYEMIGGDGELYGPFTIQQLQDNLSHGRANAQTKIRETGTEAWQPLGQLLNLGTLVAAAPPSGTAVVSDQPLDVGLAFSSGWALFKEHMGLLIGAGLLYLLIVMVVGLIGAIIPFAQLLVQGPMTGGFIILTLNLSRYGQAEIGDLFLGFKSYGWLLLVTLVQSAAALVAILPGLILMLVGGLLPVITEGQSAELSGANIAVLIVGFGLMLVLATIAGTFTYFPLFLIADKRAGFGDAFVLSYRAVKNNFWKVLGLFIGCGLVALVSAIPCGLGLIFTMPWLFTVFVRTYEQLFPVSPVTANE